MTSSIQPAALRLKDAAAYLGVGRTTLYTLLRAGELPTAKIGNRTLIRRVDADAFLAKSVRPRLAADTTSVFG